MNRDDYSQMSPSTLVTERLLEFRSVDELQTKNMELVAAVRELTTQLEEIENASHKGIVSQRLIFFAFSIKLN